MQPLAHAFHHIPVQRHDEAVLLEERDKFSRTDHAFFRICPAYQRLAARYPVVICQRCLRLDIDLESMFAKRLVHIGLDLIFAQQLAVKAVRIKCVFNVLLLFDGLLGNSCSIVHLIDRKQMLRHIRTIESHAEYQAEGLLLEDMIMFQPLRQLLIPGFQFRGFFIIADSYIMI